MPLEMVETLEEQVYAATKRDDTGAIGLLLDAGLSVNHVFTTTKEIKVHGMTMLHLAVSEQNTTLVQYLIRKGSDINYAVQCLSFDGRKSRVRRRRHKDRLHLTCLFNSICSQNVEMMTMLVKSGADVNLYDRSGSTALWHGIDTNNSKITEVILNGYGCEVDTSDGFQMAPLHVAAVHKNPSIIQQLLAHNVIMDPRQLQGATPLYIACRTASTETVKLLLQHGSDPNLNDYDEISPLHIALDRSGNPDLVWLLLDSGAFVYSRNIFRSKNEFDLLKTNCDLADYMGELLDTPRSLKTLTALHIKSALKRKTRGRTIYHLFSRLPLPKCLTDYLQLKV